MTKEKLKCKKADRNKYQATLRIDSLIRDLTRHKLHCFDLIQKEEL